MYSSSFAYCNLLWRFAPPKVYDAPSVYLYLINLHLLSLSRGIICSS